MAATYSTSSGRLVECSTPDDLELKGYYAVPRERGPAAVLFIHGQFENFYLPTFVQPLENALTNAGFGFLTGNTRAHDYWVSCRRLMHDGSKMFVPCGGSREVFANCLMDLEGWLGFLEEQGFARVLMIGHSHGALKAAFYATQREDTRVPAVVLLSPSDDYGLQVQELGDRFDEALSIARAMIDEGKSNDVIPPWAYGAPITAEMYWDMFRPDSDLAMFRFQNPDEGFHRLADLRVHTRVLFGAHDRATASASSRRAVQLIKNAAVRCLSFDSTVLPGTGHTYEGMELELATIVTNWASNIVAD